MNKKQIRSRANAQISAFANHKAPLKGLKGVTRSRKLASDLAKIEKNDAKIAKLESKIAELRVANDEVYAELDDAVKQNRQIGKIHLKDAVVRKAFLTE